MLPDLPEFKRDYMIVLTQQVRRRASEYMPGINQAAQHLIHEGRTTLISRADGTSGECEMKHASAEIEHQSEIDSPISREQKIQILDSLAQEIAKQISEHVFATMHQGLDEAGQVIDHKGQPLDADVIMKMLEKMHIDFDAHGQPKNIVFVTGADVQAVAARELERMSVDPELQQRFEDLMNKKRMEYRDREAARKLVG